MGGRLEHEIRLLPQVLSCSFSKDGHVVVLIDQSADPDTIQRAVERILRDAGSEASVRVIGPAEPVDAAATRVISPLIATATVATVAAIGVGAFVGGLAAEKHPSKPPSPPKRPAGSAAHPPAASTIASPIDSVDALRRVQVPAVVSIKTVAVPAETPDHPVTVLPASRGSAAEAVSLTKAIPPVRPTEARISFQTLEAGHTQLGRHKGKGPRPWSHSAEHSARDHHGKGKDRA